MPASPAARTLASMTNDEEQMNGEREQALLRLKKRRDFQNHVVVYLVVNTAVWLIWAFSGSGYPWPVWVTGTWAIGLLLNAWEVFVRRPITEGDIDRELERLRSSH